MKKLFAIRGGLAAIIILVVYVFIYQYAPFGDFVDRLIQNLITVSVAMFSATILTMIARYFQPGEPPRIIWAAFAAAIWCWTIGEVIWAFYNLTVLEVPSFSAADVFWFFGYVFLTFSIVRQYRLIFPERSNQIRGTAVVVWFIVLLSTGAVMLLFQMQSIEDFMAVFYPIGDFVIGALALMLVVIFQRGWLARPWISLLAFVVSDALYIWATSTGQYDFNMSQDTVSMVVDTLYIVAYLVLGWGVFQQYLLLSIGTSLLDTEAT